MKTTHFLLATCLFLAPLSISASAQNGAPVQNGASIENEAEFTLHRYAPRYVRAESLYYTLESMYGRDLTFKDRRIENLTLLDESVVIYENDDRMKRIVLAISQLDTSGDESNDVTEESDASDSHFTTAEVSLLSYVPENFHVTELFDLASDLYGRDIVVGEDWYNNLRQTSQSILIYEGIAAGKILMAKIAELDASQAAPISASYLTFEYQPRHVSANGLMEGIRPFIMGIPTERGNSRTKTNNVSLMNERGILVIRDTEDKVKEIIDTLKRLDQPAAQMMLVCQVLRGVNNDTENPADAELQKQLRQLLPHESYSVEVNGMLRGSAAAGSRMELKMIMGDEGNTEYKLQMRIGAYDSKTGALSLEGCELSVASDEHGERELFRTVTTIYAGEHAVIGVTGSEPLFLVVQMHPVEAPQ
jgi:hypothetical protein